jgi:hypothetical protein
VAQRRRWGTIQEDVERCRAQGSCTPAFDATAITQMARIHVRRRRKPITTAHGWLVVGTIARVGPDGTPARVFLQEELFGWKPLICQHVGYLCVPPANRPNRELPVLQAVGVCT